jgi:DNA modification methylase
MPNKYRRMRVDALHPFHTNPRRGDVAAIAASLEATGQYKPIVVNAGTLTGRPDEVLAGNHTLAAARSLGWDRLDVVVLDVDDATANRIVLADNRTADLGTYDDVVLAELLGATDLTGTGYDDGDLTALLRRTRTVVHLTDVDDAPAKPERAVSAAGDVWVLGDHRLLVGTCHDTARVVELVGDPVDAVWTDPPYGVNYSSAAGRIRGDATAIDADAVWRGALPTILAATRPGGAVYFAMPPGVDQYAFVDAAVEAGVLVRQILVWVKNALVLGRSDYQYRSEPVAAGVTPGGDDASDVDDDDGYAPVGYGFTPGGAGRLGRGGPHWHGDNKASNVFEVPKPSASRLHPTMKPVDLVQAMLRNSVPPGGRVLDVFAGSGSTMIAAHAEGMTAYLVEEDPLYADVICQRWQEHTGIVPVRDGRRVSFVAGGAS